MSLSKRSTLSPSTPQNASTRDLKQRVITCLNKLSDRDTHTIATTELESIARNLSHDSFSPFLNCIYYTDPSQKSPVRKQCVRLLGFVSEIHGDSLSPYLSKMISNIVRRLRDSDSNVRSACVDAVTIMATKISRPPFSVFLKPLTEAIFLEQDQNSQSGSALCLASAIEASPDPDLPQLQRFLPRLMKLLKNDSFKAKPALLNLITSIVGVGGASNHNFLVSLIPCLVEFLSSEDWAVRKASAETLARLAVMERDLLSEFKSSCLSTFESRRYDKVKAVRDTMNFMIEAWKDVPDVSDEVSPPSQSKSSSRENASDGRFPNGSRSSVNRAFESPETRKKSIPTSRATPPDASSMTTARQRSPLKGSNLKSSPAMFRKLDRKKPTNWKVEISVPHTPPSKEVCRDDLKGKHCGVPESRDNENDRSQNLEVKRAIFNKNDEDKMHKFGGFRSGSRVVPLHHPESIGSTVVANNATEELHGNNKNNEDMSLIRKQLVQIENQQSSLLDLLQKFMGSSQDGMRSLETRVHGLELALDEISYDLAISTGRMSNPETGGNTCCRLPGAEFLSSKFWKRTEGRYSTSRFSSSGGTPLVDSLRNMVDRDHSAEHFNVENRRFRLQGGGGFVVNPLANTRSESRGNSEVYSNRMPNSARNQVGNGSRLDVAPPVTGIRQPK
ncbi:HEAT [Macleaya cordata]|uniref:HEAT n=1 Tax=Macleaya cordata TaxID=56857 RepID=A0A200QV49_MACCD|nr:HEAT [Macleaya cordata]